MNVTANCQVCEESFNCANRKPLVLPCGHTYCLACLTDIEASGDKLCPACREKWDCKAYKLPISYMLIPNNSGQTNTEEEEKSDYNVCYLHSYRLEYWCHKCLVATCKECISENHYAHGNVTLEWLLQTPEQIASIKENFPLKVAPKVQGDIKASIKMCNEGLKVIELIKESEKTLVSFKKYLLAQEKCTKDFVEDFDNESSTSLKGKLEILAKIMTRCDIQHSLLSQKMEVASSKLSTLNAGIKLAHENLKKTKESLLFEELNWKIEGEKHAQKILNILGTSDVQPPDSVTVMSTQSNPIQCLSELLIALAGKGCSIRLLLLDSFLHGVQFLDDYCRLEPMIKKEVGKSLAAFYGYIVRSCNWLELGTRNLCELGLFVDSGAAVADLNAIVTKNFEELVLNSTQTSGMVVTAGVNQVTEDRITDVAISKTIIPADVTTAIQMTPDVSLCLHIMELKDKDITWCSEILPKLIPLPANLSCELWLHRCKLSKASMEQLVIVVKKTRAKHIRLHAQQMSDAEQKQVEAYGAQQGIAVSYSIPDF